MFRATSRSSALAPQRPRLWRVLSVGLGASLGVWTVAIAAAYVIDAAGRGVWATKDAPGFALGVLVLAAVGALLVLAAVLRTTEIRSGILFGGSVVVFLIGLFAGGNFDRIGGLLGLPAILGILAATFALVDSKRWLLAGALWLVCSLVGIALAWVTYLIAWAIV